MSYGNVGRTWTPRTFRDYLGTLTRPAWAKSVTLHHTAAPSLAQRPGGLTAQHMVNLRNYYEKQLGWSRGPHLFTDEDEIHGMTPLTLKGTHAVSFNGSSIGIEALGNYDSEDPKTGRGLAVWQTTAQATLALLDWLGLEPTSRTVLFHRDDPRTSKTCPGTKVDKDWVLDLMRLYSHNPAPLEAPAKDLGEFAPVVATIHERTGRPWGDVTAQLTRVGAIHSFAGSWLEGAYYDTKRGTTVAPMREIEEAIAAWK